MDAIQKNLYSMVNIFFYTFSWLEKVCNLKLLLRVGFEHPWE